MTCVRSAFDVFPELLAVAASKNLTPEQRSLRSRMAAACLHAEGKTNTAAATRSSPASVEYWANKIDPDGALPEAVRLKRAEHARRAHMLKLALASSRARAARRARNAGAA